MRSAGFDYTEAPTSRSPKAILPPPTNRHIIENQNIVNYLIYSDLCFLSYPKIPINIKEDASNCVSDFSYLNSLT